MSSSKRENKLSNEKSPYLLQHKDNPVWWLPWGAEAFKLATKENKPIFLSIGYSTCHWCHVMEKDSFEKDDVAQVLNGNFVAIKLDREERPDIDSIYMMAAQAMTGHGGWPLSVLMTPQGQPFWAGTFVAHDGFVQLLTRVAEIWKSQASTLKSDGLRFADFLKQNASLPPRRSNEISEKPLVKFFQNFQNRYDSIQGGSIGAPKFPPSLSLMVLLRLYRRTDNPLALEMVQNTLQKMRRGGIYDQVGFGFARYSTDEHWLVPHFEKMLYDNALLASTYLETYQVAKQPEFAQTAAEIFEYILRDMTSENGGFYSAEDADSEHIEGKFYVWSEKELKNILTSPEFEKIKKTFNVTSAGNFHAHKTGDEVTEKRHEAPALSGNILYISLDEELPDQNDIELKTAMSKMLKTRSQRVRPHLDDKIIVSWNALMISAFAKGFQILNDKKYLDAASKAGKFLLTKVTNEKGELMRAYREGKSVHGALSDDYALLIQACLDLYECDFDGAWYEAAMKLQKLQDKLFWDSENGGYFDNDGRDPHVISRAKSFEDGVTPSANSISAMNLLRLSDFNLDLKLKNQALEIMRCAGFLLEEHPQAATALLQSVDRVTDHSFEIALTGALKSTSLKDFLETLRKDFYPNKVICHDNDVIPLAKDRKLVENKPTFYICQNYVCNLPITDSEKALEQLKPKKFKTE